MYKIPYDASRKSLYHPGEADDFFQFGFALTDEKALCAEMSRLAYVKEIKHLEDYLERAEFELHWSLGYGGNGTQLFIAKTMQDPKCPPLVIVAFRGTEPDDPSDLLTDAIVLKKTWLDVTGNPLGQVHTGFADALLGDTGNSDILTQLSAQLNGLASTFPRIRILLTGHSIGAALAILTAGYLSQPTLANNLHIYSFGSPRVGDSVFLDRMAKIKHDRYVNYCDLVTRIPSESLGYQHVGTLHFINRHGSVIDSIAEADMTEGCLKASVAHLMKHCIHKGTVWVRKLTDHNPINYLSSVARYANFDEVKIEEYPYIHALRNKRSKPKNESNDEPNNLVGIAFSGGGIRSATFGLGVLEALKEKDLLQNIDYLSTVSGGGYIGSWLSANCHRQGKSWIRKDDTEWKESINHLRRNSNYLSPSLSMLSADTWSMGTIWLRNTLLLQLMIVMGIASLLLLPRIFSPIIQFGLDRILLFATFILSGFLIISIAGNLKSLKLKIENSKNHDLPFLIKHIPLIESGQIKVQFLVIVSMLISLCVSATLWVQTGGHQQALSSFFACIKFITFTDWPLLLLTYAAYVLFSYCSGRKSLYHWLIPIPASMVMNLLLATTLYLLDSWVSFADTGGRLWAFAWVPPIVLCAFSLAIITFLGIQGRGSYESVREWWSRFAAWLAIYGFAWMLIVTIAFYGPLWTELLYYEGSWKTLGTGWIGTTLAGLIAGKSGATGGTESKGISTKLMEIVAKVAPLVFIAGLLIVVSLVLHLIIANNTPPDPPSDHPFSVSRQGLLGT
ncbi:MAG: patatin-like phospholipase family protein, partial [Methylococcaceae bacterium]